MEDRFGLQSRPESGFLLVKWPTSALAGPNDQKDKIEYASQVSESTIQEDRSIDIHYLPGNWNNILVKYPTK